MNHDLDLDESPGPLAIVIPAPRVPASMVLIDQNLVAMIEHAEAEITKLKVTDAATAVQAAELLQRVTKAGSSINTERLKVLRPFLDIQREINGTADQVQNRIELVKQAAKAALKRYDDAQRQLAAEAERARLAEERRREQERLAELARLEKIQREEREAAQRQADAIAAKILQEQAERDQQAAKETLDLDAVHPVELPPAPEDLDTADPVAPPVELTPTEKAIQALKYPVATPPAPIVAPKIQGVAFRSTLEIVSTDNGLLPDAFVTRMANMQALRAAYVTGWKEGQALPVCPGVVFRVKREPVTR